MTATASLDAFLSTLRTAAVVDAAQLDEYLARQRATSSLPATAEQMAEQLVRDGFLTHFQSQQFLNNRWQGLTLGKYRVLERIGRGATGSVYLARHATMNRQVALKVLPAEHDHPAVRLRFEREARAGASLDHPNIIKMYDFDHEGDLAFIVMEYAPGTTLLELVQRVGPLPVTRACHYARQAALGLQHIHESGLVHRDIKPANLLLDSRGTVKILDLGLARFFSDRDDQLTMQHDAKRVLGTADYLAPEQALNSHGADIRADIYSLGGTLYFMLAGRTPYGEGPTVKKLIWAQTRPADPLAEQRPDLPPELVAVVERMMSRDPAQRFQSPAEVAAALAPWTRTPIEPPSLEELAREVNQDEAMSLGELSGSLPFRLSSSTDLPPSGTRVPSGKSLPPAGKPVSPSAKLPASASKPKPAAPPAPAAPAKPVPQVTRTVQIRIGQTSSAPPVSPSAAMPRPGTPPARPSASTPRPSAAKPRPSAPAAKPVIRMPTGSKTAPRPASLNSGEAKPRATSSTEAPTPPLLPRWLLPSLVSGGLGLAIALVLLLLLR